MNKVILKLISAILIIVSVATSQLIAGEVFRYKFEKTDTLNYRIIINSDLTFPELGNLVQLVNLDRLTHNVEADVSLAVKSIMPRKRAIVKIMFNRISAIMIAGDSVYVEDGSDWGRIKSGSEYTLLISERGEIDYLNQADSVQAKQVIQTMQRFFPIFPDRSIELNYAWIDSVNFELETPDRNLNEIESSIKYKYEGEKEESVSARFAYAADGQAKDSDVIKLAGTGHVDFDNEKGRLISNNGDIAIDADVSLAAFGLPAALGTTRVHIDSKIELDLIGNE